MRKLILFSAATLTCLAPLISTAEPVEWEFCSVVDKDDFLPLQEGAETGIVDVKANDAQLVDNGTSVFTGDVIVVRDGQELTAGRATYNRHTGDVTAQGDVKMRDSDAILTSQQAEWSLSQDVGLMVGAEYLLRENHARGEATSLRREGTTYTNLKNASYTTCSMGDDSWLLKSKNVSLDHVAAVGTARNVTLKLAGVPVFYTPYISFPLNDDRKSGFLVPSFGVTDETGFELQTPYYWNIAPNQDATLSPRYMSERGLMLNGEYRYLYGQGNGIIDVGYLKSDSLESDGNNINPYYQKDRKHFTLKHEGHFLSNWNATVDYNYVSDNSYLEDFSPNLSLASTTHLNRLLNVGYNGNNWKFTGRLRAYQTLTNAVEPYKRLPQLLLKGNFPNQVFGLNYGYSLEYVDFDHNDKISGQRINVEPSVSLPLQTAYSFFTPRISVDYTRYNLERAVTEDDSRTPTRTVPVASIDSGLFFERTINFVGNDYLHTLEPRMFYLYVPEREQSDIPIFDSRLSTFNMGQLFAYDRFSGSDRVGDTNQLSLAITSRFIDSQTGREHLRLSLGQIQYFSDREVSLKNNRIDTQSDSDLVAEMVAKIASEWTVRSEIQWNNHDRTTTMSSTQLRYRGNNGSLVNLGHRYRRQATSNKNEATEQVDISAKLPITKQWSMVGRWYRSLKYSQTLETLAGVQYESCCWASRLVVRDYINDVSDEERNLAIFFQIELKGLGNFGQNTDALLQKSILGYGS